MRRVPGWALGALLLDGLLGALLFSQAWFDPASRGAKPWDAGDAATAALLAGLMGLATFAGVADLVERLLGLPAPRLGWQGGLTGLVWAGFAASALPPLQHRAAERGNLAACLDPQDCPYACPRYLERYPGAPERDRADDAWLACARQRLTDLRQYAARPGARHPAEAAAAIRARLEVEARVERERGGGGPGYALRLGLLEAAARAGALRLPVVFRRAVDWDGAGGHRSALALARELPGRVRAVPPGLVGTEAGLRVAERAAADALAAGGLVELTEAPTPPGCGPWLEASYVLWPAELLLDGDRAFYGLALDWTLRVHDGDRPPAELYLTGRSRGLPGTAGPFGDTYLGLLLAAHRDLGRQLSTAGRSAGE